MFSFGKEFQEIWGEIPNAETYQGCIDVIEKIKSYSTANLITGECGMILLDCLEAFINVGYVPKTRAEWVELGEVYDLIGQTRHWLFIHKY